MALATVDDVATELGRAASSPEESGQWSAWIDRVERSIRRRFTRAGLDLDEAIADGQPTSEDVRDTIAVAVARKAANPAGLTSVTRSIDDGSITTRREGGEVAGLDLTDAEWAVLMPAVIGPAFSTRPGFEPDSAAVDSWT